MSQTKVDQSVINREFTSLITSLTVDKEIFIDCVHKFISEIYDNKYIELHSSLDTSKTNVYFLDSSKKIYYIDTDNKKHKLSYNEKNLNVILNMSTNIKSSDDDDSDSERKHEIDPIIYLTSEEIEKIITTNNNEFHPKFNTIPREKFGEDILMSVVTRRISTLYPNINFYSEDQSLLLFDKLMTMMNIIVSGAKDKQYNGEDNNDEDNKAEEKKRNTVSYCAAIMHHLRKNIGDERFDELLSKRMEQNEELPQQIQVNFSLIKIMLIILCFIPNLLFSFVSLFMRQVKQENNDMMIGLTNSPK